MPARVDAAKTAGKQRSSPTTKATRAEPVSQAPNPPTRPMVSRNVAAGATHHHRAPPSWWAALPMALEGYATTLISLCGTSQGIEPAQQI